MMKPSWQPSLAGVRPHRQDSGGQGRRNWNRGQEPERGNWKSRQEEGRRGNLLSRQALARRGLSSILGGLPISSFKSLPLSQAKRHGCSRSAAAGKVTADKRRGGGCCLSGLPQPGRPSVAAWHLCLAVTGGVAEKGRQLENLWREGRLAWYQERKRLGRPPSVTSKAAVGRR